MRETAATTGKPTEVGDESAEDRDVSTGASHSPEAGLKTTSNAEEAGNTGDGHRGEGHRGDASARVGSGESGKAETSDKSAGEEADGADSGAAADPLHSRSASAGLDGSSEPADTEPRTFTRPPGMTPPPEHPDGDGELGGEHGTTVPLGSPVSATAPVSGPPGGVRMRPLDPSSAIGSARVNEAIRATRSAAGPRGPRRARLAVKRLDPWSVMKFSFAVSLVLFIVMIVAASVLYLALDAMGVFTAVNSTLSDLIESGGGGDGGETFRISASWVIGTAASLGAINVVLFTALATLGAFIYNVCADLVGGVEVTLAERD